MAATPQRRAPVRSGAQRRERERVAAFLAGDEVWQQTAPFQQADFVDGDNAGSAEAAARKHEFWGSMVVQAARAAGRLVIDPREVATQWLVWEGRPFIGMRRVIREMVGRDALVGVAAFRDRDSNAAPQGWGSWLVDTVVSSPVKWSWRAVAGGGGGDDRDGGSEAGFNGIGNDDDDDDEAWPDGDFVVVALVDRVLDDLSGAGWSSNPVPYATVSAEFARLRAMMWAPPVNDGGSQAVDASRANLDSELGLVLARGTRRGVLAVIRDPPETGPVLGVRFADAGVAVLENSAGVTEADVALLSLRSAMANLEVAIERLEGRVAQSRARAKDVLRLDRALAMEHLRHAKATQATLIQRHRLFHKLDLVAERVIDGQLQGRVLESLAHGTAALRAGLPAMDEVDRVFDDLEDALADDADVRAVLGARADEAVSDMVGVDDAAIEAELDALIVDGGLGDATDDASLDAVVLALGDMSLVAPTGRPGPSTAAGSTGSAEAEATAAQRQERRAEPAV